MYQFSTPLFDQLLLHTKKKPISLHVPGHKDGHLLSINLDARYKIFKELLTIDATELIGLDDLHSPSGPILESERLLAEAYGAKKSYFLVNGSTVGNLAMILSMVKENDDVLVQRNCHKSILNGISLAKGRPIFLSPEYDEDWLVSNDVSYETLKKGIELYPNAKTLILTYPNYYGMTYDLGKLIRLAHDHNITVLVDEAHGAHFIGSKHFPQSAIELGADLVVQSAHKTLPAMTMGAYLHINNQRVSNVEVEYYLTILQSSSPSYLIMASLDIARSYVSTYSELDFAYLTGKIKEFKKQIECIKGIRVLTYRKGLCDPLKMTIQTTSELTGFEIQARLEKSGIYTELADPYNVLFVLPLLKNKMDYPFDRIVKAMKQALIDVEDKGIQKHTFVYQQKVAAIEVNETERKKLKKKLVPLDSAMNQICADVVIPYPPGIPILFPGEKITTFHIEYIKLLLTSGAKFQGTPFLKDGTINVYVT
ncbi:aminotransferase class I/II-fold pyridoxal phosphate-dependent enzyme [Bacillus sp. 03113]|uniref:aminotransferase class I/II-fold pyridoxal phosphate-dependent enzyme n=1 Tax=Bacillus sp. 03113 TaxID=2578211 RepID=UPI001144D056|nr:aminotransferase class I/II-fold pyridoxal phosphate-dependent enzyme [Bacillus sp. 03113]